MKNIKYKNLDPIVEAKKNKKFAEFSRDADMRINLGIEIYNRRKELDLSQQALAKKINTTQKVISNIENADVDIQSSTLNRINSALNFTAENWSRIYNFALPREFWGIIVGAKNSGENLVKQHLSKNIYNSIIIK